MVGVQGVVGANVIGDFERIAQFGEQGVLALIVCAFATELSVMAYAADWQIWHGRPALLALGVFVLLVAYGYWASTPRGGVAAMADR